jgi:hypothetical protein
MDINLCRFPNDAFHASRFLGQETGVVKLDEATHVHAVLLHGLRTRMVKSGVPMMLADPGLDGAFGLFNADIDTFAWDAVYARCSQVKGILDQSG